VLILGSTETGSISNKNSSSRQVPISVKFGSIIGGLTTLRLPRTAPC
jgi:hypothetical protein